MLDSVQKVNEGKIFGIIGIVNVNTLNYLAVITAVKQVGVLSKASINKITSMRLLSFKEGQLQPEGRQDLEGIRALFCDGFYYSYGYDLTCSRQRRIKWLQEKRTNPLEMIASDKRYFWNLSLYRDFISHNIDTKWFTPLIQGYFGQASGLIGKVPVVLTLMSRRCHLRAGTRYNARGIDDFGYVGNQVETEQILVCDSKFLLSHVQIRGSVPIFWEQSGITEMVRVTRPPEMTKIPFNIHFNDILDTYGPVQIINLLAVKTEREVMLTTEYVRQVYESDRKSQIKFLNFDFHHYTRGDNFQALKVLIQKVDKEILNQGWLVEDVQKKAVERMQNGIVRTNCLDSLDRTNVAQSKIGLVALQLQLQKLGFDLEESQGSTFAIDGIAFMYEKSESVLQQLRAMWTEMGDYLSRQYAGTDSTISKVSRDGAEGFMGKVNHKVAAANRFVINTFSENPMQKAIDTVLGKNQTTGLNKDIKKLVDAGLLEQQENFSKVSSIKISVGTWNIAGIKPYESVDLTSWLLPQGSTAPDVFVLGFQEICDLNMRSYVSGNNENIKVWNDLVFKCLKTKAPESKYQLLRTQSLFGLHIMLISKQQAQLKISDIADSKVSAGVGGHKGAVCIRFKFQDTSFCFLNCHLEGGEGVEATQKRFQMVKQIYDQAFQAERGTINQNYETKTHEVKVLLGDMNFKIDLSGEQIDKLIQAQDFAGLMRKDELYQYGSQSGLDKIFQEGQLLFNPTYKYKMGQNNYDPISKPSYADRIIFCKNPCLTLRYYNQSDIKLSDHKPVSANFDCKVRSIDQLVKKQIEDDLVLKFSKQKKDDKLLKEQQQAKEWETANAKQKKQIPTVNTVDVITDLPVKATKQTEATQVDLVAQQVPNVQDAPKTIFESKQVTIVEVVDVQEKKKLQVFEEEAHQKAVPAQAKTKLQAFDSDSSDEDLKFERPSDVPRLTIQPKELERLIKMTTLEKTDQEMLEAAETYKPINEPSVKSPENKSQPLPEEVKGDARLETIQEINENLTHEDLQIRQEVNESPSPDKVEGDVKLQTNQQVNEKPLLDEVEGVKTSQE